MGETFNIDISRCRNGRPRIVLSLDTGTNAILRLKQCALIRIINLESRASQEMGFFGTGATRKFHESLIGTSVKRNTDSKCLIAQVTTYCNYLIRKLEYLQPWKTSLISYDLHRPFYISLYFRMIEI